ncbi:unnamed protein product [Didymodactylos carnosus]|uniref:Uncharacterized protein n=1 Tax=Didymodactylos carnosus TaxID=1234261 RepID=A0A815BJN5_9BILA|nr:unnamed protein product [Didymodactylos carnosus]CAF4063511.1 unnamed protein product [Didymodactylos carnosus]
MQIFSLFSMTMSKERKSYSTDPLSDVAKAEILSDKTRKLLCGNTTRKIIEMLSTQIERCDIKLCIELYNLFNVRIINRSSLIQFYHLLQQLSDKVGRRSSGFAIQHTLKKPLITQVECLLEAIEKLERTAFAIELNDSIRFDEYSSAGHLIPLEYALNESSRIFLENIESNEIDSSVSLIWIGLFFTSIAKSMLSRVYVRIINPNLKNLQEINNEEFTNCVLEKDDGLDLKFCIDTASFESTIALSITNFNKSKKEANQVSTNLSKIFSFLSEIDKFFVK